MKAAFYRSFDSQKNLTLAYFTPRLKRKTPIKLSVQTLLFFGVYSKKHSENAAFFRRVGRGILRHFWRFFLVKTMIFTPKMPPFFRRCIGAGGGAGGNSSPLIQWTICKIFNFHKFKNVTKIYTDIDKLYLPMLISYLDQSEAYLNNT